MLDWNFLWWKSKFLFPSNVQANCKLSGQTWLHPRLSTNTESLTVRDTPFKRDTADHLRLAAPILTSPLRGSSRGKSRQRLERDLWMNCQWVVLLCVRQNRLRACGEVEYMGDARGVPKELWSSKNRNRLYNWTLFELQGNSTLNYNETETETFFLDPHGNSPTVFHTFTIIYLERIRS